ncbi:hypothetical protein H257_00319 [Aphanomyces astaci]|uniref:Uncharacterized protein n=1 Tax=Aphanomyces astaci TaxID=112090 RepID=W4HB91_APHAT|nr:hypothetical protein H257_00319 [Aphanomyces astaci]ETV88831.1 hypothetical protein H257_00319 [Aphanomyces astaci]|eukprot:XP_009821231.1 hypothetical protein H257_00319 [Aphanomyces astaci]
MLASRLCFNSWHFCPPGRTLATFGTRLHFGGSLAWLVRTCTATSRRHIALTRNPVMTVSCSMTTRNSMSKPCKLAVTPNNLQRHVLTTCPVTSLLSAFPWLHGGATIVSITFGRLLFHRNSSNLVLYY